MRIRNNHVSWVGRRLGVALAVGLGLLGMAQPAWASDQNTPRSLGMGGSLRAAATGATAIFLNPAGMTLIKGYAITAFYDFHVQKNGHLAHSSVVDSVASKWVAAGLYYNMLIMRPDVYERSRQKELTLKQSGHETGIALAVPLGSRVSLGATVKYLYYKAKIDAEVEGEVSEVTVDKINNVGVDAGVVVRITEGLTVGVSGMNLVPQKSTFAPITMGMGISYSYKTYVMGAFDVQLDFTSRDEVVVDYFGGAEVFLAGKFAIRGGAMHRGLVRGTYVTAGFGYINPKAGVDVFLVQQVDGGIETRVGFAVTVYVTR